MEKKLKQGQFEVIDSFAIRRRNEFYLIGELTEGVVKKNWFLNIPFNTSLSMTVRISMIEDIEINSENKTYKLLIISGNEETIDLLLLLNISSEYLDITIDGKD